MATRIGIDNDLTNGITTVQSGTPSGLFLVVMDDRRRGDEERDHQLDKPGGGDDNRHQ